MLEYIDEIENLITDCQAMLEVSMGAIDSDVNPRSYAIQLEIIIDKLDELNEKINELIKNK